MDRVEEVVVQFEVVVCHVRWLNEPLEAGLQSIVQLIRVFTLDDFVLFSVDDDRRAHDFFHALQVVEPVLEENGQEPYEVLGHCFQVCVRRQQNQHFDFLAHRSQVRGRPRPDGSAKNENVFTRETECILHKIVELDRVLQNFLVVLFALVDSVSGVLDDERVRLFLEFGLGNCAGLTLSLWLNS